jgi:integrase/recombinase XerD
MDLLRLAESRSVAYLLKDEVEGFFRAIPEGNAGDRLVFDLIYRYGLRRTEAALIRREHLSDGRIWITRVKSGVSGEYPIHPTTRRLIWAHLNGRGEEQSPYLFTTRQSGGKPVSESTIYGLFRRYAAATNLPATRRHPHVLRHSIAVHLMNAG